MFLLCNQCIYHVTSWISISSSQRSHPPCWLSSNSRELKADLNQNHASGILSLIKFASGFLLPLSLIVKLIYTDFVILQRNCQMTWKIHCSFISCWMNSEKELRLAGHLICMPRQALQLDYTISVWFIGIWDHRAALWLVGIEGTGWQPLGNRRPWNLKIKGLLMYA